MANDTGEKVPVAGLVLEEGVLRRDGEHIGFVYDEEGEFRFYPARGVYLTEALCDDLGVFLGLSREERESRRRKEEDCPLRKHNWKSINQGLGTYECVDCGEPGFWVATTDVETASALHTIQIGRVMPHSEYMESLEHVGR